jgi:hypothetical protein
MSTDREFLSFSSLPPSPLLLSPGVGVELQPIFFFPTLKTFLEPVEWKKFDYSVEEEKEVLRKRGLTQSDTPVGGEREEIKTGIYDDMPPLEIWEGGRTHPEKEKEIKIFSGDQKNLSESKSEVKIERGGGGEIKSVPLPDFLKDRKRLASEFWRGAVEQGIINPPTLTHTTPPEKKIPSPPPVREAEGRGGEKRTRKIPDRLTYLVKIPDPDTLVPKTLKEAKNFAFWEGFEEDRQFREKPDLGISRHKNFTKGDKYFEVEVCF